MQVPNRAEQAVEGTRIPVLVMDQGAEEAELICRFLVAWNFEPLAASSLPEALALVSSPDPLIVVIADPVAGTRGVELVRALRQANGDLEAILIAEDNSAGYATQAFCAGIYDCLQRPINFNQLSRDLNTLRETFERKRASKTWEDAAGNKASLEGMVGFSSPMQAVFAAIRRFAAEDSHVLITGLIGTGKEMAARAIHELSPRSDRPLVIYRCCGVSEPLAAMELFGERGRATAGEWPDEELSQTETAAGLFEAAAGGTVLLDEIGELPLSLQRRLESHLRAGQPGTAAEPTRLPLPVRVLATSRFNLARQTRHGQFDKDLYGLLSRNVVHLPSLGERPEDLPLLSSHFREKFSAEYGRTLRGFSPAAEQALSGYGWPGNVRELENVIGRACLLADVNRIELEDLSLPPAFEEDYRPGRIAEWAGELPPGWLPAPAAATRKRVGYSASPAGHKRGVRK